MQRSRKLLANGVNHVRLALEGIQRLADILPMQIAHDGIRNVIEQGGREDALVACEIDGFQERRIVHVVGGAPRAINPMGTSLKDVVLEIVLILEQYADGFGLFCELLQTPKVPFIERGEVVFRHTVPGQFRGKR